ncbi:MAG: DUF1192 domain-containing protein [Asticcacaulis sp.]
MISSRKKRFIPAYIARKTGHTSMEDEPSLAFRSATLLSGLTREDLDPYSVEDLQTRIAVLEDEITRAKTAIDRKKNRRTDAEALFSFKGI